MTTIRKLGFCELRMHLMHELGAGTTQGALRVSLSGDISFQSIFLAMTDIQSRHKMLNVIIKKEGEDYYFCEHTHQEGYIINMGRDSVSNWNEALLQQNETLLNPLANLWRLAVYQFTEETNVVTDIIFVMHHAIMDAVGSEHILDALLNSVANINTERDTDALDTSFPIALENDAMSACTWEEFVDKQHELKNEISSLDLHKHLAEAPLNQRATQFISFEISDHQVIALDKFCRENNISLNSLLATSFLKSVHNASKNREKYALFTALSLRPLCPNVDETGLGCYLSVAPTFHEGTDLEDLVAEACNHKEKTLKAFLDRARWVPSSYETNIIKDGILSLSTAKVFSNDVGFTYAETGIQASYGDIDVNGQYVISRRNIGNVSVILHGLRSKAGIQFTLSYVEPIQSKAFAKLVTNNYTALLSDIAVNPSSYEKEAA